MLDIPTRVDLEAIGLTEHGRRYRVTYAGQTLVEGRRNPIFDACRALLARGLTGRLEVWRQSKTSADMQLDIERAARLAIKETATESLRVVSWEPWRPIPDEPSHGRVSYRAGCSRRRPRTPTCARPRLATSAPIRTRQAPATGD
jgi:hypothetical protein